MNYTKMLENLNSKVLVKNSRRYSLSELISESYKSLYACGDESNLRKLVEAHLEDVRQNPADIERLSHQLSALKEARRLTESGKLKDQELLVSKEKYSKVVPDTPKKEEIKESKEEDEDLLEDTELTDEEVEELTKHLAKIRKDKKVEECSESDSTSLKGRKLAKRAIKEEVDPSPELQDLIMSRLADTIYEFGVDPNSLGELLDELIYNIAKLAPSKNESRKLAKKIVRESSEGRVRQVGIDLYFPTDVSARETENNISKILQEAGYDVVGCMFSDTSWSREEYGLSESRAYSDLELGEFSKKSSTKAFYKTFKKLQGKLKEGTALTRQESINLYKAANSALTHLSVELEHNPNFLQTFKESVSLLSKDVESILNGLKENKAPSKKTMKSLFKFSESLLTEADEEDELPPIEDEEDEFVGSDEGDITSEEAEEFDQEYADARVELHKELADEHADSEDPEVQEKLAQDAEEVVSLPGISDEQVAEIEGGESSEDTEEDDYIPDNEPDEEVEEDLDLEDREITDDELEALKKHLQEMRKVKRSRK